MEMRCSTSAGWTADRWWCAGVAAAEDEELAPPPPALDAGCAATPLPPAPALAADAPSTTTRDGCGGGWLMACAMAWKPRNVLSVANSMTVTFCSRHISVR